MSAYINSKQVGKRYIVDSKVAHIAMKHPGGTSCALGSTKGLQQANLVETSRSVVVHLVNARFLRLSDLRLPS